MAVDLHPEAISALEIAQGFRDLALKCNAHQDYRLATQGGKFTTTGYAGTYTYAHDGLLSALGAVFGSATAEFIYQEYILESDMDVMEAVEAWQRGNDFV